MGGNQSKEDDVTASARSDRITTIGRTERVMHRKETKPSSTRSTTKATTSTTPTSSNKKSQSNGKSASVSTKQEKRALKNKLKDSIKARSSRKLKMPDLDESGRMSEREVTSRREISSESSSITIADGKITIEYAFCTQRGYYPDDPHKPNQDSHCTLHPFANMKDDAFFAVFDGHGPVGEHFASYAKTHLPPLVATYLKQEQVKALKTSNAKLPKEDRVPFNPKFFPPLGEQQYQRVCRKAYVECNREIIDTQPLVNLSGSTAISAGFHNGRVTISNVGDSRAILGYRDAGGADANSNINSNSNSNSDGKLIAVPLSQDQTPWRKDERERIRSCGGRCLTLDQLEGKEDEDEGADEDDRKLGENGDIDVKGDPPRVWLPDQNIPGCSFTRSLGDSIADEVGVCGDPETFTKTLTKEDELLVLASDGVFEFLPNQDIIDICATSSNDPVVACDRVVDAAYYKWLEYENRTDDITAVILFIRHN